jgi:hypothetical protein
MPDDLTTPHARIDPATISGWGVDADPDNDPTYPMRDQSRQEERGLDWRRPSLQPQSVEVLMSIEHKRRPAVFGAANPPRGLSGAIRRRAFAFSESQWAHWLLLVLADRVDVIEGVVEDFRKGAPPNPVQEMGLASEWKYNRKAALQRSVTVALAAGVLTAWWMRRRR